MKAIIITAIMLLLFQVTGPSALHAEVEQADATGAQVAACVEVGQQDAVKALNADWTVIRQSLKAGNFKDMQASLKALEGRCMDLGVSSFEELSASMIKEGRRLQDDGKIAYANAIFDSARRISPNYPASYYASGWAILAQNKLKVLSAVDMFVDGFRSLWRDFRFSFYYAGNKFTSLLFTLAMLFSLFGFFMALRYTQLLAHDISESLGKPELEYKLKLLIIPASYTLILLTLGYWWAVTIVLLSLWVYFNKKEKALAVLFFLLIIFMPDVMYRMAGFVQTGGNRLLWVMDDVNRGHIRNGARESIEEELKNNPDNKWAVMSLAQLAKKQGSYDEAESLYSNLVQLFPESAIFRNNLANVYFIEGKNDEALKEYQAAVTYQPDRFLPYFNMSQIYSEMFMFTERDAADSKASRIDPGEAARLRERAGDTPVRMVFDEQIPVDVLWKTALNPVPGNNQLASSIWSTTIRVMPLSGARAAGIGFIMLAIGIGVLRKNKMPSHYCVKCGKVSCKACQRPTYHNELCAQCNQIFVRLEGVEARDRVQKMLEVRDIHRVEGLRTRIASLLLPGSGHFLMGFPIRGILYSGVFVFVIKDLFFGDFFEVPYLFNMPFIRPTTILAVIVFVLFYVLAQASSNKITKKRDVLWH